MPKHHYVKAYKWRGGKPQDGCDIIHPPVRSLTPRGTAGTTVGADAGWVPKPEKAVRYPAGNRTPVIESVIWPNFRSSPGRCRPQLVSSPTDVTPSWHELCLKLDTETNEYKSKFCAIWTRNGEVYLSVLIFNVRNRVTEMKYSDLQQSIDKKAKFLCLIKHHGVETSIAELNTTTRRCLRREEV